jgi:hypothetical protein
MKKTHGKTVGGKGAKHATIYAAWKNMKQRCLNPNNHAYSRYGGAGIVPCKRWLQFENFYADMGDIPEGKTLDRINNSKGYTASNCRWATPSQQAQNSSRAKHIAVGGKSLCISEWCRATGITYGAYKARVKKGWTQEKALTTPPRVQRNSLNIDRRKHE